MGERKQPRSPSLEETLAGAERAAARVAEWPAWKRELSMSHRAAAETVEPVADRANPPKGWEWHDMHGEWCLLKVGVGNSDLTRGDDGEVSIGLGLEDWGAIRIPADVLRYFLDATDPASKVSEK